MSKKAKETTLNDFQRPAYQLTINNPETYGYTHTKIKELLISNFTTLRFFCMADEIGINKTPHTHIYMYCNSRVRFTKVKKHFPEAHIEIAHGNVHSNIEYIKKTGKWEDTEKAETKVAGTYEEWGDIPVQNGTRADMEQLFRYISTGYTNAEILTLNNDLILNIDKLDKLRTTLLMDQYKDKRRLDLKVVYISGATGTGKTRGVLDTHGDANVYRVTDYQHPFDGYACQPVMVFDEFRSGFRFSDVLQYCDVYSIQLPARYANKFACYEILYIISNWRLEEQYPDIQREHPESWKAFLRRISEVYIYDADGTITKYSSVTEYLERNNHFHSVTEEEQLELPFKKENNNE